MAVEGERTCGESVLGQNDLGAKRLAFVKIEGKGIGFPLFVSKALKL